MSILYLYNSNHIVAVLRYLHVKSMINTNIQYQFYVRKHKFSRGRYYMTCSNCLCTENPHTVLLFPFYFRFHFLKDNNQPFSHCNENIFLLQRTAGIKSQHD